MTSVHNKQAVSVLKRYVASKSEPGKGTLRCEGFGCLQLWHRVQQIRMLQREVIRCIATSSLEAILDFPSTSHLHEKLESPSWEGKSQVGACYYCAMPTCQPLAWIDWKQMLQDEKMQKTVSLQNLKCNVSNVTGNSSSSSRAREKGHFQVSEPIEASEVYI